jgi:hypothetical protein
MACPEFNPAHSTAIAYFYPSKFMAVNNQFPPKALRLLLIVLGACSLMSCKKNKNIAAPPLIFDSLPLIRPLVPILYEVSGIADSKINPGYIWTEQDSGNPPEVYLVRHDGVLQKKIYLKGIVNRDWEDLALFNDEVYLAETGDNAKAYTEYAFYKFSEPPLAADTVSAIETIRFVYPDGSHDAEAFLIDPDTKNIFIITKSDNPSRIYRLSYPYGASNTVGLVGSLPYTGVVSAALSADGSEIIVKTYTDLYYYRRQANEPVDLSLKNTYTSLAYQVEPQGEAVCFARDGSGFFTLSEKGFATTVDLYFYKRN